MCYAQAGSTSSKIREEGVYRLDRAYLESIGINVATVNPKRIKVYQNGGEELDKRVNAPRISDLQECAIFVSGEEDERFNANDFVLFYAKAASGIKYDSVRGRLTHYLNRLSNSAFVFLALDGENGKRIRTVPSVQATSPLRPSAFEWLSFVENDRINFSNTGLNFFDSPLTLSRNRVTYNLSAAGIDRTRPVQVSARIIAATTASETFILRESGSLIAQRATGITQNLDAYILGAEFRIEQTLPGTVIQGEQTNTQLEFLASSETSNLYLDWIELSYARQFVAQNDLLRFNSLVGLRASQAVQYEVTGFSATPTVWDITDLANPVRVAGEVAPTSMRMIRNEQPQAYREYVAFSERTAFLRPASAQLVPNQNLHSLADASNPNAFPEHLIVYGEDFRTEAERLAAYRSNRARHGDLALRSVAISVGQIYNEFSGGKQDFTAIRDFVKLLYDYAPAGRKPKYLLLFGDGDWDYRDITGRRYSKVPVYSSEESLLELSYAATTDDFFVSVNGEDLVPDLAVGRFTVQSLAEARTAVDKTIEYETAAEQGDWRNRVAFVADDGPNGNKPSDFNLFVRDSENTIEVMRRIAPYINPVKIYASFFRAEAAAGGMRRPGAAREIITQLNRGALIINYIGHGNPSVWAAERIFEPAVSLPQLFNRARPTLCITATCDFGRNDDPN
ncbi:MAG: type IX secretion system sortase PorU [Chloroherpetonaceae bacterium]|nr:type IX secretion system sortase PorU [Chloroherpetonaceae bacterium]